MGAQAGMPGEPFESLLPEARKNKQCRKDDLLMTQPSWHWVTGRSSDLFQCGAAFPVKTSGIMLLTLLRNLQQRGLLRIYTGFPFHPDMSREPITGGKGRIKRLLTVDC